MSTLGGLQGLATPSPDPDQKQTREPYVFSQAKAKWPILNNPNILYKYTPKPESKSFLEAYPPGERGTKDSPRPSDFPIGKYGIEVYKGSTRPIDVLGDVVSHFLRNSDPKIKRYYSDFEKSLTPEQVSRLHQQYDYSVKNEGEKRSYEDWYNNSGLPAYFRGYAFQQWPKASQYYTPDQIKMFNSMMQYLESPQ